MTRSPGRITQIGLAAPTAELPMSDPLEAIERLSRWFRDAAAPLWAHAAWDERHGGFYESLSFDGRPIRGARRVRVQSRQIYTFSMIGLRGWHEDAEPIAAKGFDYLVRRACPDNGERGCVHALSDDGAVIDAKRDLYDQAFVLLACAGRIRAADCERARALAERTAVFLDHELASPYGGWVESDKRELPRRQNPHMHLFEAFVALYQATDDPLWLEKARAINGLFDQRFYNAKSSALIEFLSEDLECPDPDRGGVREPGHMMEWVWLLGRFESVAGVNKRDVMDALYGAAMRHADADGFLPDAVEAKTASGARRLWPQTEFIKAAFTLSISIDDSHARDGAAMIDALFDTYLNQPVEGLWCDQYNGAGAPIAADVPASILYHLYEAVAGCLHYAEGKKIP